MEIACHGKHHREVPTTFILQHHEDTKSPPCMLLWRPCIMSPVLHMMILVDHHPVLLPPVRLFLICLSLSVLLFILSSVKYEGPWLSTQIMISSSIGMVSLLIFSYCRTRWPLIFAPRTKLKGTSTSISFLSAFTKKPLRVLAS